MRKATAGALVISFLIAAALGIAVGWRILEQAREASSSANVPSANSHSEVRIGTFSSAIDYAPFIVAREKGWIAAELQRVGSTSHFTQFETIAAINEALASNQLDVIFEAEPPVIVGRAAGIDLQIIGISCTLRQEIITRKNEGIDSVAELKGRSIAVLAGTSSHYGILNSLSEAKLASTDVRILDLTPPDAKAAFSKADVDAWAVWPPWVEQELLAGTAKIIPGSTTVIQSLMVARSEFATVNPDATAAISTAIRQAKQWMVANPKDAQALVATSLKIPEDVVALAWPKHDWTATLNSEVTSDIQAKANFLLKSGRIHKQVDVSSLIRPAE